jgi:hypothetical protein
VIALLARKSRAAFDVLVASTEVARARRTMAQRPIGALVRTDADVLSMTSGVPLAAEDRRRGERWGAAVDRALRWLPGDAACLVRASALRNLVVTRGLPRAVVCVGVRRGAAGFQAHAWVAQDGTPVAEPDALRGAFASLDGVTLD